MKLPGFVSCSSKIGYDKRNDIYILMCIKEIIYTLKKVKLKKKKLY
jgi:hypothetical protein